MEADRLKEEQRLEEERKILEAERKKQEEEERKRIREEEVLLTITQWARKFDMYIPGQKTRQIEWINLLILFYGKSSILIFFS